MSRSPHPPPSSLRRPRTPFIGRHRDVADVIALLERHDDHVVTITGPGGVGKTRLALEIASALAPAFDHDVAAVFLAPVADPAQVLQVIATTLGVPQGPGGLATRLQAFLRDRRMLLVLDNFEHLPLAATDIAAIAATSPEITLLITSRAPLGISAEQVYPLDTLSPEAGRALFIARARAADPAFSPTDAAIPVIDAIADRLDRLPLALELAAARIRVLPPAALLARLDHRLQVLTGGPRDAPDRQQTMAATIAWSYDLLDAPTRARFRRLGVFRGGFTLDAARAISGAADPLDLLDVLVRASLVRAGTAETAEPRYLMLETIREFAVDQLEAHGEGDATRDAHAAWCLDLATRAAPHWYAPDHAVWLARLESEHDNLRAALAWTSSSPDPAMAVHLITQLVMFWLRHSHFVEGKRWTDWALARTTGENSPERMQLLRSAAELTMMLENANEAISLWEQFLETGAHVSDIDETETANALLGLAEAWAGIGELQRARELGDGALGRLRRLDGSSQDIRQEIAKTLVNVARIARSQEDWDATRRMAEEGLAILRSLGFVWATVFPLFILGTVAEHENDDAHAAALYLEALGLILATQDRRQRALVMDGLMFLAAKAGHPEPAGRLYGAATRLYQEIGGEIDAYNQDRLRQTVEMALRHMPEEEFAACVEAGRALSLDDAMAEARQVAETLANPAPASLPGGLTPREAEVLRLVAQGQANRTIGETLSISERTVEGHLVHIMAKLNVESRTAAAIWAVRHGLA